MKNELIGKTISNVVQYGIKGFDDEPYIEFIFDDGTSVFLVSYYGGYTGKSADEYPSFIDFSNPDRLNLVEVNYENKN